MTLQERIITLEIKFKVLEERITTMDEERTWLTRLVLGLVISSMVGVALVRHV